MKIGFVGLGNLGRPVALAIQRRGHDVIGYDVSQRAAATAAAEGLQTGQMEDATYQTDIVFVAVQTPHAPEYEGITRLPAERRDFDYTWLRAAAQEIARLVTDRQVVAVISTVLPGTMEREILPILAGKRVCYNPSFIAMGTVERDFLYPEFVLLGVDDEWAADRVEQFYGMTVDAPVFRTSVRNAELIKVAYNTYISQKIAFANTLMEICHKTGCDVDAVTSALAMAHRRLMSPAYLSGGMGDGGACHPRDNIALSWLARTLDLSYDLFESVMVARERHAGWLTDLLCGYDLPKAILGTAYKPQVDIVTGSPALLVRNLLAERGVEAKTYDPYVDGPTPTWLREPHAFLIGTRHPEFADYRFAPGSVVLDPWRYIPPQRGVEVIGVGRERDRHLPVVRVAKARAGPGPRRSLRQYVR